MKHWCGKGILEKDRKRGRCGRCGLSVWLPPPHMTEEEKQRLMQSRGPTVPDSIVELLSVCNHCERGRHAQCEDEIHWFCVCYRARHDTKLLTVDGFTTKDTKAVVKELGKRKGNTSPEDEEEWESFV